MAEVNELEENLRGSQISNSEDADEENVLVPGQMNDNSNSDQYEMHTNNVEGSGSARSYRIELNEHTASDTKEESCNDEVVPFTLDEDFDYDNVVLTPKFTIHEMKDMPK